MNLDSFLTVRVAALIVAIGGIFCLWLLIRRIRLQRKILKYRTIISRFPNYADVRCVLADLYLANEMYKQAYTEYDAAIGIYSSYAKARLGRAQCLIGMGDFVDAYAELRKLEKLASDDPEMTRAIRSRIEYLVKRVDKQLLPRDS